METTADIKEALVENKEQDLATASSRTHLRNALKEFTSMMVATYDKTGKHPRLHVEPMLLAKIDDDCTLTFVTRLEGVKPNRGESPPEDGNVIAQSLTRQITMLGTVEYSNDRKQISDVWKLPFNLFLGSDKSDENVWLITFKPRDAELWDLSGRNGLRFLFDAAKSLLQRKRPDFSNNQHEKLKLYRN